MAHPDIEITSISQPGNLITLVASITNVNRVDATLFNYHLTYTTNTYISVSPTSQDPSSGDQNDPFTLTVTFSQAEFPYLYTYDQAATYFVRYDNDNDVSQSYTYQNPNSFTFNSFTVTKTSDSEITASATFTASLQSPYTVLANNFTYTVVISGTTYTYTGGTAHFSPTVNSTSFSFIFTSSYFSELFSVGNAQLHTLNFTKSSPISLNVNSSTVSFTFTTGADMTLSFTSVVLDTDITYVLTTFTYTYSGFTPSTDNLTYRINSTDINSSDVSWTLNNSTLRGTARFSTGTSQTKLIFKQGELVTHIIRYQVISPPIGPFYTSILNTVYTIADSNNIIIYNPIITITIQSYNKSIMLPPVAKAVGILYHIKILSTSSPYIFTICPFLTGPCTPLITYLYTISSVPFDSQIEGNSGSITLDSTHALNTYTLISDGANWWILNFYLGNLSIGTASSIPSPNITESTETNSFKYVYSRDSISNLVLHSMSSSYLKYIFIQNISAGSINFTLYFPYQATLENVQATGQYANFTFTVSAGSIAGFILTYLNGIYYIISATTNPSITTETPYSDTPILVSSTITRLVNGSYFQLPFVLNLDSSHANLIIIKAGSSSKHVKGVNNVFFQTTSDTSTGILMSPNSVIWFIIIQDTNNQYYLPISYLSY